VIWETLAGQRLFDGATDVEIFKKIRACQVPPIAERRPDIPPALAAVLDVALAAEPANRFATATEFASALSQVMKLAVGVDPATALGTAVREARVRARRVTATRCRRSPARCARSAAIRSSSRSRSRISMSSRLP